MSNPVRIETRFLAVLFLATAAWGQVTVATGQYDVNRSSANLSETVLTPANVNTADFGKLFSRTVDGYVYAQPLYIPGVKIGARPVNVLYVATLNDTVYAFDADHPGVAKPLWKKSLGKPVVINAPSLALSMGPVCGIMSTPVIDTATNTMYLVAMASVGGVRNFQLHALDITSGSEKFGGPVLIGASVPGTSPDAVAGKIRFKPHTHYQRPALLLNNGDVWVMFGAGLSETKSYHGWAIPYNAATLAQDTGVWNATSKSKGNGGGIWMSGRGAAADANGVYLTTGNGADGPGNYGEAVVRLDSAGFDWFVPDNYAAMNQSDWDVSAGGPLLMPGTPYLVSGSKVGLVYLLNRTNLGHYHRGNTQILQTLEATPGCSGTQSTSCTEVHAMAYWARTGAPPLLYVWGRNDVPRSFAQNPDGTFQGDWTTPFASGSIVADFPGGIMSLSANGNTNGILWSVTNADSETNAQQAGTLHALDAVTLQEKWNSGAAADSLGNAAKFCIPTVANGKVYVATFSKKVNVYGLRSQALQP